MYNKEKKIVEIKTKVIMHYKWIFKIHKNFYDTLLKGY